MQAGYLRRDVRANGGWFVVSVGDRDFQAVPSSSKGLENRTDDREWTISACPKCCRQFDAPGGACWVCQRKAATVTVVPASRLAEAEEKLTQALADAQRYYGHARDTEKALAEAEAERDALLTERDARLGAWAGRTVNENIRAAARAAAFEEAADWMTTDEAGALYFNALMGKHRGGPPDVQTMLPVAALAAALRARGKEPA